MQEIFTKARAKINLNLLVTGKRADDYHNIKSVFQKVNLYDELFIKKIESNNMVLKTNVSEISNEKNILFKTYIKLKEIYPKVSRSWS